MGVGIARQRVGDRIGRIKLVDHRREVRDEARSKSLWIGVLRCGPAGFAHLPLQIFEPITACRRRGGGPSRDKDCDLFVAFDLA